MATIEEVFLYIALIAIIVLVAVKLIMAYRFNRAYNANKENNLLLGVMFFFLFMAISRISLAYFDFVLTKFDPLEFQANALFWKFASIFQYIGFFCLIFSFERVIFEGKTWYLISVLYAIMTGVVMFISDFLAMQFWAGIPIAIAALFIPISYIYLAKKSQGEIRKKALIIFAGFILYAAGLLILGEDVVSALIGVFSAPELLIRYILHIVSVGLKLGAIALLGYGYLK
jgi:hypothetical protein